MRIRFDIDSMLCQASIFIHISEQVFTYMNGNVKSAARVLDILEVFASTDRPLALRDVVRVLGLPKSSASMLLNTLIARGYLVRNPDETLALAPAMDRGGWVGGVLGHIYRVAQPWMDDLLAAHEETVVLGAATEELDVRILTHRVSPLAVHYDMRRTAVIEGYCTAMGRALMAHMPAEDVRPYIEAADRRPLTPETLTDVDAIMAQLDRDRRQGFSLNIEERFQGAAGAAVAICDPEGRAHAAINIASVTPRFRAQQPAIIAALIEAARGIEAEVFHPDSSSEGLIA